MGDIADFYSKMLGVELKKSYLVPETPESSPRMMDKLQKLNKIIGNRIIDIRDIRWNGGFDYDPNIDLEDITNIFCVNVKIKLEKGKYYKLCDAYILDFYYENENIRHNPVQGIYQGSVNRDEFWPLERNAICIGNLAPFDIAGIFVTSEEPIIIDVEFYINPLECHDYDFGQKPYEYRDIKLSDGGLIYSRDQDKKLKLCHLLENYSYSRENTMFNYTFTYSGYKHIYVSIKNIFKNENNILYTEKDFEQDKKMFAFKKAAEHFNANIHSRQISF